MYRTVFNSIIYLVFFCSCKNKPFDLPYYNSPDFTPYFLTSAHEIENKIPHKIGNFELKSHHLNNFSNEAIKGKVHIANFMFTSCTSICPIMTNNLKIISEAYKNHPEFLMMSFSVTPWIDSIPRLQSFAKSYGITAKNWHLLTGKKSEIYRLARKSYFAEKNLGFTKDSSEFLHTEHVVLVDQKLRLRGIYNATLKLEMKQLKEDIAFLLKHKKNLSHLKFTRGNLN